MAISRYIGVCKQHPRACVVLSREPEPRETRPFFKCPVEGCGHPLMIYEFCAGVDQVYAEIWLTGGEDVPRRPRPSRCMHMFSSGDRCCAYAVRDTTFCRVHTHDVPRLEPITITIKLDGQAIAQTLRGDT